VVAHVEAGHPQLAGHVAPVVVRDEAARGSQQGRLPGARTTGEDHELPFAQLQVEAAQRFVGAGVRVAEAGEAKERFSHGAASSPVAARPRQ
jgi:hypothetical protein